jgi:hypothetical protein
LNVVNQEAMLHLNFTSIIPQKLTGKLAHSLRTFKIPSVERAFTYVIQQKFTDKLTDKLKGFKITSMNSAFTSIIPQEFTDKLKNFKIPTIDRTKIKKFFYEAYLDVHEDDSLETLRNKVKSKK